MAVSAAEPVSHAPATPAPAGVPAALAAVEAAESALRRLDFKGALDALEGVRTSGEEPRLVLRALTAEGAAKVELGDVDAAAETLEAARALCDRVDAAENDRAAVLCHLAAARLALGAVAESASLLTLALDLSNRASAPNDLLRSQILERRARCHRHNRDWAAARADVERALELAESLRDERAIAQACLQASVVAEREGQWILAQFYAERARETFVQLGDVFGAGKCLNNL